MMLMLSGGGLTTVDTAERVPIRLVESGPAGGAALASAVARQIGGEKILSFDMGGTTAKICFVDAFRAEPARLLEVARQNRFIKGSGIPLRIPAIQMVEIGAGGGSIARVDAAGRIQVGPDSAGSEPGPASYGRGGTSPTVTDADLLLGAIDADAFANGTIALDAKAAENAVAAVIGEPLGLGAYAAHGIREVVDETMAMAARAHAVELGKELANYTIVAFGGAGPLHAARLAQKLGVSRILIPPDAGVGSAVGFLLAPVSYDVSRSLRIVLDDFDDRAVRDMLGEMQREAVDTVRRGSGETRIAEKLSVYARYVGQGHEIELQLPGRAAFDAAAAHSKFEAYYTEMYGRLSPSTQIEIMSWVYSASAETPTLFDQVSQVRSGGEPGPRAARAWLDPGTQEWRQVPVYHRTDLAKGEAVPGPALVVEPQTTTVVTGNFAVHMDKFSNLILERV
jgi:N-methylhydantoinase A